MTDTGVHVSVFHTAGIISDHSEQITVIWKHHDTCKTMINNTTILFPDKQLSHIHINTSQLKCTVICHVK